MPSYYSLSAWATSYNKFYGAARAIFLHLSANYWFRFCLCPEFPLVEFRCSRWLLCSVSSTTTTQQHRWVFSSVFSTFLSWEDAHAHGASKLLFLMNSFIGFLLFSYSNIERQSVYSLKYSVHWGVSTPLSHSTMWWHVNGVYFISVEIKTSPSNRERGRACKDLVVFNKTFRHENQVGKGKKKVAGITTRAEVIIIIIVLEGIWCHSRWMYARNEMLDFFSVSRSHSLASFNPKHIFCKITFACTLCSMCKMPVRITRMFVRAYHGFLAVERWNFISQFFFQCHSFYSPSSHLTFHSPAIKCIK